MVSSPPLPSSFALVGASFTILIIDSISFTLSLGQILSKSSNPGKYFSKSSFDLLPLAYSRMCLISEVKA